MYKVDRPSENNLSLMIFYTRNVSSNDIWSYEHKTFISPENLHYAYHYSSPTKLEAGVSYRVAFMWRDSAYNYSNSVWRVANYESEDSFLGQIYDSHVNFTNQNSLKEINPSLEY